MMTSLLYLKDRFSSNSNNIPIIGWKERILLALVLLFDLWYIIANSHKAFIDLPISNRTLNILSFGLSAVTFVYILKEYLYNTLDISSERIKKTFVYAGIAYIISFLLYWAYNTVMTFFRTPLGGDVQKLRELHKLDLENYLFLVGRYAVTLANEEFIILAVFLIAFSFMKQNATSVLISSCIAIGVFALLHAPSWNWATVPGIMISKLPHMLLLIYFLDVKPIYLAHLFNNIYVSLALVEGMTGNIKNWIFVIFLLPLAMWLISHTISDIAKEN